MPRSCHQVATKLVSTGSGLVTGLLGENLEGILATEVLVVLLAIEVLVPVLTSHWVHGGLNEEDDLVCLLPWSEVTTFHSVTMGMDTSLSLSLPPQ